MRRADGLTRRRKNFYFIFNFNFDKTGRIGSPSSYLCTQLVFCVTYHSTVPEVVLYDQSNFECYYYFYETVSHGNANFVEFSMVSPIMEMVFIISPAYHFSIVLPVPLSHFYSITNHIYQVSIILPIHFPRFYGFTNSSTTSL